MSPTSRRSLAGLLLALAPLAAAQEDRPAAELPAAGPAYRFQVLFENDGSFVKLNELEDRHYTNGAALDLAHKSETFAGLVDGLGLPADGTAVGLMVAHEIYTPEDITARVPDPDDRPYAGYLYGAFYGQREHDDHLDHLQLNLGVVGESSLAKEVQEYIHEYFTGDDPNGWDSQLGDEFAIDLAYRRTVRIDAAGLGLPGLRPGGLNAQLLPYGEVRVGTTHRDATLGGIARVGWKLPDDFGPARVRDPGSFTGAGPQPGWSVYAFAGAAARYVQWNTFLDGSYARNPSPSVDREPLLGIFRGGFAVGYTGHRFNAEIGYAQTFLTHEFKGQEDADAFGQIQLQVGWGF
ncbi:lipid A deacylase LpxR family protein [Phycisphaera mikurensis]|uniref:Lipid A deacylase LpxR family protein n=1 Tax=Phycisphaera mikurensis (strain NBRC 102666 / KCTC 22515 / FYK2301M01) TaxID=1142394 RepID=I0IDM1_PHYMF|nr:lipid A deacylase LpxR family protein [Phycisphaera mikurensis]MBB6441178.1 hypothetical protein [Phycisphaera mikurensis]BAM03359.1 hypothetical protein PSMK_12000 [Phycisphaera mikurensis NBRC 102666]